MKKAKRFLVVFAFAPLLLFLFMILFLLFDTSTIRKSDCPPDVSAPHSTETATDSSLASDSDWTKEGTVAYKNAQKVFQAFVNAGVSGEFAAGVVGWVNSEGGFAMIGRAEGHYGNDLKSNSIAYGVIPSGLSYYSTEAGGGIFQFTPYTKYAPLGSPDWENADKMIAFVIKAVSTGDWNPAHDMTGKNHSFEQAVQLTNPQEASLTWNAYERGNQAYIHVDQKKADAQKAYEVFGGSKYKFNKEKFEKAFGGQVSGVESLSTEKQSHSSKEDCSAGSSSSVMSGDYAHIFDSDYQVLQPYGYTPWSTGSGASLYASSGGKHTGVDVATLNAGDGKDIPVYSMTNGKVYSVSYSDLGGHAITIQPEGTDDYLYYGHLKYMPNLKTGQSVKKGDKIAVLGNSGQTNIYHVHLEYSSFPSMGSGKYDKDPSFLFQKEGTLKQDQIIQPKGEKK